MAAVPLTKPPEGQVPVFQGILSGVQVNLCNARDLHGVLQVHTKFADWITGRILEYGFVAGEDFSEISEKVPRGRPRTEYHLTLDMAKELAMVENNDKGRQVRRYFIQCERAALSHPAMKSTHRELDTDALPVSMSADCLAAAMAAASRELMAPTEFKRYLVSFNAKLVPNVSVVPTDAMVASIDDLVERIRDPDMLPMSNVDLAALASACSVRLSTRLGKTH